MGLSAATVITTVTALQHITKLGCASERTAALLVYMLSLSFCLVLKIVFA